MNKFDIELLFERLCADNPTPSTELNYTNTYTLLVAVVLSAQSTDKGVNKATDRLFQIIETPHDMVKLGIDGLISHIKTIGLYNSKAKNIMALSEQLISKFNGNVPTTREDLQNLPGVGRKTANVVLNVAYNQPTIAVDTHIFRVSNRTGIAIANTPEKVEAILDKQIPDKYKQHAHHWLILHGRYICKAKNPDCNNCKINDICKEYSNYLGE